MSSLRAILFPLLLAFAASCGGAAPAPEAPAQKADTAPPPPPAQPSYGQPSYSQPPPGPPAPRPYGQLPAPAPTAEAFDDKFRFQREATTPEEAELQLGALEVALTGVLAAEMASGRCERACRALASMERSAERLCELAGSEDERCASARDRVEASTTRVTDAGCGC